MMESKIEYAKYLGAKVFSNKYYSIHVMLYDHGMARARLVYKKRKSRTKMWSKGKDHLTFDECRHECVLDIQECLYFLQMDKTARRWFRKTLRPCFEKYLLPNGDISSQLASEGECEQRQEWRNSLPEMDIHRFGRDDVLSDERAKGRNVEFHTGDDDMSRLDAVASRPRHARPPLSLHVDKERLLDIIRTENPEFYEFLAPHGYDKIEHIRIFCYPTEDNPERVDGVITVKFPCPVFYEIPRNDDPILKEEEDRVLWWMYYKNYSRFKKNYKKRA